MEKHVAKTAVIDFPQLFVVGFFVKNVTQNIHFDRRTDKQKLKLAVKKQKGNETSRITD